METERYGMGAEREPRSGPARTVEQAGEWAADQAHAVGDRVREGAGQAAEQLQEGFGRVKERVAGYGENLDRMKADVSSYAREQPMTALLVAAGVGLVLGWMTSPRR